MARAKQERGKETVRYILEAIDQIVTREGAGAVSMKRVAEVAGVGVGTVYHHFGDRVTLLREAERCAWKAEFEALAGKIPAINEQNLDASVRELATFAVESIQRRIDAHGVTMDDPDLRTVMFELFDQAAALLLAALAPVAPRLRRPDALASLRLATEAIALLSWIGTLRHRDRIASGELQREIADMLARYLLCDPDAP